MTWKEQISNCITKIDELGDLGLSVEEQRKLNQITIRHPMRITPHYYSLINKADPDDPIRKMCVPQTTELERKGTCDTSGEAQNTVLAGVQHKYERTVLLLSNHRCAMYCRHCFRKRLVGLSENEILTRVDEAVNYIQEHPHVNNILITGGDPLLLDTHLIKELLDKVINLEQLDFIRIGSRIPVTLPQRILEDEELLEYLKKINKTQKRLYIITHINHPHEISAETNAVVEKLLDCGIILSNQGVLLKGVNNDAQTIVELHRKLIRTGIQPYYVFQCRPVRGIKSAFQVPLIKGIEIIDEAKSHLDGISKRFRYIMSTKLGKCEVLGQIKDRIIIKLHQSRDNRACNKIIQLLANDQGTWLTDFKVAK